MKRKKARKRERIGEIYIYTSRENERALPAWKDIIHLYFSPSSPPHQLPCLVYSRTSKVQSIDEIATA